MYWCSLDDMFQPIQLDHLQVYNFMYDVTINCYLYRLSVYIKVYRETEVKLNLTGKNSKNHQRDLLSVNPYYNKLLISINCTIRVRSHCSFIRLLRSCQVTKWPVFFVEAFVERDVVVVLWGSCAPSAMFVVVDVLLLKWCDVHIVLLLDLVQFWRSLLLCGVQFCCMRRGFLCFT
jgi:hypothetical protein